MQVIKSSWYDTLPCQILNTIKSVDTTFEAKNENQSENNLIRRLSKKINQPCNKFKYLFENQILNVNTN